MKVKKDYRRLTWRKVVKMIRDCSKNKTREEFMEVLFYKLRYPRDASFAVCVNQDTNFVESISILGPKNELLDVTVSGD